MGVNECGSNPSRLVEPINKIKDISIRAHVCPLRLCMASICFAVSCTSHCWSETRRLLINRLGVGNRMLGNMIIRTTIGKPIIVGVVKEENRFSFIFFLRD